MKQISKNTKYQNNPCILTEHEGIKLGLNARKSTRTIYTHAKAIMNKNSNSGSITMFDFKLYFRAIVIKSSSENDYQ
jgi:hypothetical protein